MIPSHSIDLVICDLPYGRTRNSWDTIIPFDALWGSYNRVIKENGAILLFADGMFMADLMQSNRKMWRVKNFLGKNLFSGFFYCQGISPRSPEKNLGFFKKAPTFKHPIFLEKTPHWTLSQT